MESHERMWTRINAARRRMHAAHMAFLHTLRPHGLARRDMILG